MSRNYYEILGISPQASEPEIRSAYEHLCQRHRTNSELRQAIDRAHRVLRDKNQRQVYDQQMGFRDATEPEVHTGGQFVTHQQVPCPKCHGSGRRFAGLLGCDKCGGQKTMTRMLFPANRQLCTLCHGWCYLSAGYMGKDPCGNCDGSGLEPAPKVVGPDACPSCHGIGTKLDLKFHYHGLLNTAHRDMCKPCRGTGSTVAAHQRP